MASRNPDPPPERESLDELDRKRTAIDAQARRLGPYGGLGLMPLCRRCHPMTRRPRGQRWRCTDCNKGRPPAKHQGDQRERLA